MYKNEEYLKLNPAQMVHYIRTKHKKYLDELPSQLEKWVENQKMVRSDTEKYDKDVIPKAVLTEKIRPEGYIAFENSLRRDIAVKILCSINPGREDAAAAVDYALELTDELLKKIGE